MEKGIQLNLIVLGLALVLTVMSTPALAGFGTYSSSRNGSDGPLEPQSNFVVPVIQNGVAHNDGVYYFTTVNIPAGVTVTFEKNAANTPITILANGDVTITGTISVNGSDGISAVGGAGGPGGFGGGGSGRRGEGPGGGGNSNYLSFCSGNASGGGGGGGGGFATTGAGGGNIYGCNGFINGTGASGGATYGNNWQLPQIIGGSGGGGAGVGGGGGGGGGAIVIASSGIISVVGSITANGGVGASVAGGVAYSYHPGGGGGGSGGAIRLIANGINCTSTTNIAATGGGGGTSMQNGGAGGSGRITFEAPSITKPAGAAINPAYYPGGSTEVPPANIPSLSIAAIGSVSINTPPKGAYSTPDVMLPFNTQNPVSITVAGRNIPIGTQVTVTATPSVGSAAQNNIAYVNLTPAPGSDVSATTATAAVNISAYPSTITASVTFNLAAAGMGPIYAAGEKVESMRVATNLGGKSTMIYITASGREIPAVM